MGRRGLTLVEVIISAVILAATVGGVLFIFSSEKSVVSQIGRKNEALDFARQKLENLKKDVRADTWGLAGYPLTLKGWTTDDPLSGDGELPSKFSGQRRYKVESVPPVSPDTGYRRVTVEVNWQEPQ